MQITINLSFTATISNALLPQSLNIKENSKAILLYSSRYTREFLQDYSDYFVYDEGFIKIKEGIEIDDIREHILSYVSSEILFALLDEKTLKVINAA